MKVGDKYYTLYPHYPVLEPWIETKAEVDAIGDGEIHREWVFGDSPVFDAQAFQRCKIFTDKAQCLKEARERLYALIDEGWND